MNYKKTFEKNQFSAIFTDKDISDHSNQSKEYTVMLNKVIKLLIFSFSMLNTPLVFSSQAYIEKTFDFENNTKFSYLESCCLTPQNVERLIVIIHGDGRDAQSYWQSVYNSMNSANAASKTAIVAPWFKIQSEAKSGELYWGSSGWKEGDTSRNPVNSISSYEIIDIIVQNKIYSNNWTNLKEVIIAGHSAGSQFVQRYAFSSSLEDVIHEQMPAINFKYIVANPSSYLYFDKVRPTWSGVYNTSEKYSSKGGLFFGNSVTSFLNPFPYNDFQEQNEFINIKDGLNSTGTNTCSCDNSPECSYNLYKYGINFPADELSHYSCFNQSNQICNNSNTINANTAISRYLNRKVVYLLGQLDNSITPEDSTTNDALDTTCMANFQGHDRLSRGIYFMEYINKLWPNHPHSLFVLPNVGHSASQVYSSDKTKRVLLGGDLPKMDYLSPSFNVFSKSLSSMTLSASTSTSSSYGAKIESFNSSLTTQKWILTETNTPGIYTIMQTKGLRYLTSSLSSADDYKASTATYKADDSLLWRLLPVQGQTNTYYIQYVKNNRYLQLKKSSTTIYTRPFADVNEQKWILTPSR